MKRDKKYMIEKVKIYFNNINTGQLKAVSEF